MNTASNPFDLEEDDNIKVVINEPSERDEFDDRVAPTASFDVIASRLLSEKLYLTALELHVELIESGRELTRLRDFFSNPSNFERTGSNRSNAGLGENSPPRLARTSSIQTFDSLDFARYSDDGERNESDRVAVLEFELRKCHDTIRQLRSTLTRTAVMEHPNSAAESSAPTSSSSVTATDEPVRQYERRALNFLINEYLLCHNYKLTSVTFSEENENQDFDDWDDVGINTAKPPNLLRIYREYSSHGASDHISADTSDFGCMVDMSENRTSAVDEIHDELQHRIASLEEQVRALELENQQMTLLLKQAEKEADSRRRFDSSTPAPSPVRPSEQRGPSLEANRTNCVNIADEFYDTGNKTHGDRGVTERADEYETALEDMPLNSQRAGTDGEKRDDGRLVNSSGSETPSTIQTEQCSVVGNKLSDGSPRSGLRTTSSEFQRVLLDAAFSITPDSRIYAEVSCIAGMNEGDVAQVIPLLARCLPFVVPNVLLAQRDELIPLIVCAAALHSDSATRDHLLNLLFNLIKRPDADQRRMILIGCVAFARHAGAARVESELLPQCWEQIGHRYIERRLLVAEACGALTPHVPATLRGSLLFSMLQQMLQDSVEYVREAAVKSLGVLVGFVDDTDKYSAIESLLFAALSDQSERVVQATKQVLLPSFAEWSMELGQLESRLLATCLDHVGKLVEASRTATASTNTAVTVTDQKNFCLYVNMLQQLIPVAFASVLTNGPFAKELEPSDNTCLNALVTMRPLPKPACDLLDCALILGGSEQLAKLVQRYEEYTGEEWFHPWSQLTWLSQELVTQMIKTASAIDAADQTIVHCLSAFFRTLCRTFGHMFSLRQVQPQFVKVLCFPSADTVDLSVMERASLVRCTAPVYASGVLAAFTNESDHSELSKLVTEYIQSAAVHKSGFVGVDAAISELCGTDASLAGLAQIMLSVIWECVTHSSPSVRAASAHALELAVRAGGISESQIASRVFPALVTLAGDPNGNVRTATVPAFGAIVECVTARQVLDKVYMQLQSFMDDPVYRDDHALRLALICSLGKAGSTAEPRFRDDFVLPRLTALAVQNSTAAGTESVAHRTETALALFDAYSAVSCCFFGDQLISEVLLPGLRCLQHDLTQLSSDHAVIVSSMIREFEDRIETGQSGAGSSIPSVSVRQVAPANSGTSPAVQTANSGPITGEAIKSKMMSHIRDVKDRANLSKLFTTNKK